MSRSRATRTIEAAGSATRTTAATMPMSSPALFRSDQSPTASKAAAGNPTATSVPCPRTDMQTVPPAAPALLSPERGNRPLRAEQETRDGPAAYVAQGARLHRVTGTRDDDELPARRQGKLPARP